MKVVEFKNTVWQHYREHGRKLPWRLQPPRVGGIIDGYPVLVSELMLQQTQVDRVLPKYEAWLAQWPSFEALAVASRGAVIRAWQGLGYNRRALFLHRAAQVITEEYDGILPRTEKALVALPGIGPYTAAALRAFVFNEPVVMIETNIRTVFLHHFFTKADSVDDREVLEVIADMVDQENAREWYWALMDYGAWLKRTQGNPNVRSRQYVKQSAFVGSNREVRGAIVRYLSSEGRVREGQLRDLGFSVERVQKNVVALEKEGFLRRERGRVFLVE